MDKQEKVEQTADNLRLLWLMVNRPDLDFLYAMNYKCPTCYGFIPNNKNIGEYCGAISRKDNKTEICSACGVKEAIADLEKHFDK